MEDAAAAAAAVTPEMQVRKRPRPVRADGRQDPPPSGGLDLISRLPDAVLGTVISLLPTKDGARTQALSRRWRPLWRSADAPLNLAAAPDLAGDDDSRAALVSRILSGHSGPARRLSLRLALSRRGPGEADGWFRSASLAGLQDLEVTNLEWGSHYPLPPHPLVRFAPTLSVLRLGGCRFPGPSAAPPPSFPRLKQIMLFDVRISEDTLQSVISSCAVLQSVSLHNMSFGRLCISSPTLRSISVEGVFAFRELVIVDAPCLERLLPIYPDDGPATIRVIRAPKLEVLGFLSQGISRLHLGTTVFQKMVAVTMTVKMRALKILVLECAPNLDFVIDFLKCFPCLEKLYVIFSEGKDMNIAPKYDQLDPIECLELHLKEVVLKNYCGGHRLYMDFVKFFLLNAKVLRKMEIGARYSYKSNCNIDDWMCYLRRQLQVENRASKDASVEVKVNKFNRHVRTHDLSVDDPFD
ncbi:F-box/LRR-repeat protein At1g06630-like [Triticum dicoccoides]|uniref:F-box/LRR-repeat protein At1g06630-like n=1 Tax=Triticum dicoccoides TaxID=85692 RepID=UPI00188EF1B7|nr:F-box/LRR-repeat protein At1g06630-like [Triticum dicoccoides]